MKQNQLAKSDTELFPSDLPTLYWRGSRVHPLSCGQGTANGSEGELMATQQFDCGRWKLRLERVPSRPQTLVG
jgi:hypothetical protein